MIVVTSCNPTSKIHVNPWTFRKELVYLVVINSNPNCKRATFTAKNISTVMGKISLVHVYNLHHIHGPPPRHHYLPFNAKVLDAP